MSSERLTRVFELAYESLRRKINGGRIQVDNEASLQLQFAAILKSVGELFEIQHDEFFSIELEKRLRVPGVTFGKSGSDIAKIDIYFSYTSLKTGRSDGCAVEMKLFWKRNHREPNNRYDVFDDIRNLESYGSIAKCCFMVVGTDHDHYVNQTNYSPDTTDFDFRHGRIYRAGSPAVYRTAVPYGDPVTLAGTYTFNWDTAAGGLHFLKPTVAPRDARSPAIAVTRTTSSGDRAFIPTHKSGTEKLMSGDNKHCNICQRELENPADPLSTDCGGDCHQCMADAGDPDCLATIQAIKQSSL